MPSINPVSSFFSEYTLCFNDKITNKQSGSSIYADLILAKDVMFGDLPEFSKSSAVAFTSTSGVTTALTVLFLAFILIA